MTTTTSDVIYVSSTDPSTLRRGTVRIMHAVIDSALVAHVAGCAAPDGCALCTRAFSLAGVGRGFPQGPICGARLKDSWKLSARERQYLMCERCAQRLALAPLESAPVEPDRYVSGGPGDADIAGVLDALAHAGQTLEVYRFAALLGWTPDDYAHGKLRDLQTIARLLGKFDNSTLVKLVRAGRETGAAPADYCPACGAHVAEGVEH